MASRALVLACVLALSSCFLRAASAQLLFAGGEFDRAGDALVSNIAQWDGARWSPLAALPVVGDSISSLAVYNGKVIAGGRFDRAGNFATNNIAQYDGNLWQPMGLGAENRDSDFAPDVWALTVYNGALIAAGYFNTAGGLPANNIARWDGAAWSTLGEGLPNECRALTVFRGTVIAGGDFVLVGDNGVSNDLAAWDGASWSPLGPGITSDRSRVWALVEFGGQLIIGGEFLEVAGIPVNNTAIWNGTSFEKMGLGVFSTVGPFDPVVKAFAVYQGALIMGGRFQIAGGQQTGNIARWDGTGYTQLGSGLNEQVYSMTVYGNDLIVGGNFDRAGGVDAVQIARWNGQVWSGVDYADAWDVAVYVRALTVAPLPSTCVRGRAGTGLGRAGTGGDGPWVGREYGKAILGIRTGHKVRAFGTCPSMPSTLHPSRAHPCPPPSLPPPRAHAPRAHASLHCARHPPCVPWSPDPP